jgi:hypothetical protein
MRLVGKGRKESKSETTHYTGGASAPRGEQNGRGQRPATEDVGGIARADGELCPDREPRIEHKRTRTHRVVCHRNRAVYLTL